MKTHRLFPSFRFPILGLRSRTRFFSFRFVTTAPTTSRRAPAPVSGLRSHHIFLALLLLTAAFAEAHAFLDRAEPKVGSVTKAPPNEVKVWFTQKLVVAFSDLQVFDAAGNEVDKHDKRADKSEQALLMVSIPPLKPGKYKVVWRAASVDTHVTHGDFTFEISP